MDYLYDGSFDGLLTAYSFAFREKAVDPSFYYNESQLGLFSETYHVKTDPFESDRLIRYIGCQISSNVIMNLYCGYISDDTYLENILYTYLTGILKLGHDYSRNYADESAKAVNQLTSRVIIERNRFIGILRFAEMDNGLFYSQIEPECNIAVLLAGHLKNRYSGHDWLVHDVRRNFGIYYHQGRLGLIEMSLDDTPENRYSHHEKLYRNLWKTFFKKIAIQERKNPKLQRQHIPVRYWKFLTEIV